MTTLHKLLFAFILLSFSFSNYSYAGNLDSLRQVAAETTDEATKLNALNNLAWQIRRNNQSEADSIAKVALELAEKLNLPKEIASAKNTLGVIDLMNGRFESATERLKVSSKINLEQNVLNGYLDNEMNMALIPYFQGNLDSSARMLSIVAHKADSLGNQKVRANILSNMGVIHQSLGEYEKAIQVSTECLEAATKMGNDQLYASTAGNIGVLYDYLKNFDKAIYYQNLRLEVATKIQDYTSIAASHDNLSEIYRQLDDWEKSFEQSKLSLSYNLEIGDSSSIAGNYINMALYFHHYANNFDSTEQLLKRALGIGKRVESLYHISLCQSQLGALYLEQGKVELAISYLKKALDIALETELHEVIEPVYKGLSEAYEKVQKTDSALYYLKLHNGVSDSLNNEATSERIDRLETQYRVLEKESKINELTTQTTQAELALAEQKNWIVLLISLVLLSLIGGGFLVYSRRKRAEALLTKQKMEHQKQLLDSTVLAEENERQRIAKDLHDGLVQTLAATKMGLQSVAKSLKPEAEETAQLQSKIDMLQDATTEARNISHQLMPIALMENGLITAMEEMLTKTLNVANIEYTFEYFGIENERFAQRIEIGFYRIAQEMVNNILKHSHAKQVEIQLLKTKTHLVLHIEDDGVGFDLDDKQKRSGIGLNNMFSRASAVNGEINFEKADPKGTSANVRVPLG